MTVNGLQHSDDEAWWIIGFFLQIKLQLYDLSLKKKTHRQQFSETVFIFPAFNLKTTEAHTVII